MLVIMAHLGQVDILRRTGPNLCGAASFPRSCGLRSCLSGMMDKPLRQKRIDCLA